MGDVLFGGAAGAAADTFGSIMQYKGVQDTNATNIAIADKANAFNAGEARTNRSFQERMSSTAYQRASADMLKAGINPIMAYSQGGASSPSGGQASANVARVENANIGDTMKTLGRNLTNTAREAQRYKSEIANVDADTAKKATETITEIQNAKAATSAAEIRRIDAKIKAGELKPAQARQEFEKAQTDWDKSALEWDNWMKRIGEGIGVIGNGLGQGIKGLFKPKPPDNRSPRQKAHDKVADDFYKRRKK